MRDEYCQTLLSHGQPKEVVSATDSSFRHSPPEKSELTPSPHELHYLLSPGSEKTSGNKF